MISTIIVASACVTRGDSKEDSLNVLAAVRDNELFVTLDPKDGGWIIGTHKALTRLDARLANALGRVSAFDLYQTGRFSEGFLEELRTVDYVKQIDAFEIHPSMLSHLEKFKNLERFSFGGSGPQDVVKLPIFSQLREIQMSVKIDGDGLRHLLRYPLLAKAIFAEDGLSIEDKHSLRAKSGLMCFQAGNFSFKQSNPSDRNEPLADESTNAQAKPDTIKAGDCSGNSTIRLENEDLVISMLRANGSVLVFPNIITNGWHVLIWNHPTKLDGILVNRLKNIISFTYLDSFRYATDDFEESLLPRDDVRVLCLVGRQGNCLLSFQDKFPQTDSLWLYGDQTEEPQIFYFPPLPNCKKVFVRGRSLCDSDLSRIMRLPSLEVLNVTHENLSSEGRADLQNQSKIRLEVQK